MDTNKKKYKKANDIHSFKGIYYNNQQDEKTLDFKTGAHFKYIDTAVGNFSKSLLKIMSQIRMFIYLSHIFGEYI